MSEFVCNYATVRFLPYRETGEFVNVGVVVDCPEIDFFDFRLAEKRFRRIHSFFPELDKAVYKAAIKMLSEELTSHRNEKSLFTEGRAIGDRDVTKALDTFRWLLRRREALLHFAEPGSIVVTDPGKTVNNLFDRLVNRDFAQHRHYQEVLMQQRLAMWLREWKLKRAYKTNQRVGDDEYHFKLPFVHLENGQPIKAIKPLDLAKSQITEVYEHGDAWVQRMRRLATRGVMPNSVIFAVKFPDEIKHRAASNEIRDALVSINVQVVSIDENEKIRELARV
jgi:hypothetical protein